MVHREYEGGTDYPEEGSEDYDYRMGLLNDGIRVWGEQESVRWRELFDSNGNYKKPTFMTSKTDKPQMSKPLFLVYYILSTLYKNDGANDLANLYNYLANNVLSEMIVLNEIPDEATKTSITGRDIDYQLDGFVFGE